MTDLPIASYVIDPSRDVGEMQQVWTDLLSFVKEGPGGSIETELTIVSGSVVPVGGVHTLDTEGDAATDDLTNLTTTNLVDGRLLLVHSADASRAVVLKHNSGGAGQLILANGKDFTLSDPSTCFIFKRTGADWIEISRNFGADIASAQSYYKHLMVNSLPKSTDYSIVSADRGALILADATADAFDLTLPSTNDVVDGFQVVIRRQNTGANDVSFLKGAVGAFDTGATAAALTLQNETVILTKQGAVWYVLRLGGPVVLPANSVTSTQTDSSVAVTDGPQKFTGGQRVGKTTVAITTGVITPDLNDNVDFTVDMSEAATLAAFANVATSVGQSGIIDFTITGAGNWPLSYNAIFHFPSGADTTLSLTTGALDKLIYDVVSATRIDLILNKNFTVGGA
jgi:hypothetical protein